MIILWTDALIYLLVLAILVASFFIAQKPQLQRPLRKVVSSKIGMISLLVLVFFVIIGLLDSVHFKSTDSRTHPRFGPWVPAPPPPGSRSSEASRLREVDPA